MASDRKFPAFPEFATFEEERRHRKQRLAAAFRLFGQFGFRRGRGRPHHGPRPRVARPLLWVNPFAMNFKQIRVKDLILVNHEGQVVEGDSL